MARRLVAGIALFTLACGGDKDKEAKPAEAPAVKAEAPKSSGPLKRTPVGADLAMLPVDSELVIGAHVAQLVKSEVYKQLLEPMIARNALASKLAELKTRCGLDPLATVERVAAGVKGFGKGARPEGVVIVHGLDKDKTIACVDAEAKAKAEVTRDGDATVIKTARGDLIAFQFTSATDAVVVFGPSAGAAAIKTALAGTALKSTQAFVDLFNQIETDHTMWWVMNGAAKPFEALSSFGMQAQALYGSANIGEGLNIDLRMKLGDPTQATRLSQLANQQMASITRVISFDKLDIGADGNDLKVAVGVTGEKLPTVVQQIQSLMGAGLGRMGMSSP